MKFRRRQRWLRRMALGFAFATAVFAGKVSMAAAALDEGGAGTQIVTAGGWSGAVDANTGIPSSAGIPTGDEQFMNGESIQVVPYLSHGILTQEQALRAAAAPAGDEIAFRNALDSQATAAAEAIHDPYLTDVFVRQGESQGGPDGEEMAFAKSVVAAADSLHDPLGAEASRTEEITVIPYLSHGVLGEAVKTRQAPEPFIPGVTDFPKPEPAATRPDDQAVRFTGPEQTPVISYLSQGMAADGEVGTRPDNRADRFTTADGVPLSRLEVSNSRDWDSALTFGIGAIVLALALGLGLGYLRRPKLAL